MIQKINIRIKNFFSKETNIILTALLLGLTFTFIITFCINTYATNLQQGISEEVVRLHVLANSDSEEDQALKLEVRDVVLETIEPLLANSQSKEETMYILSQNLEYIENEAQEYIYSQGYGYNVEVTITESYFPTKTYGEDIVFVNGYYDALKVEIGAAEGQNWWCCIFPPLCYMDASTDSEIAQEELDEILSDEELSLVTDDIDIQFKIVEFFNKE